MEPSVIKDAIKNPSPDVVIIGSGMGGATSAFALAQHAAQVLVVEEGLPAGELVDMTNPSSTFVGCVEGQSDPMTATTANRHTLIGGATKFYGAVLIRLRREDFEDLEHEEGISPAWPITYDELEPYYCKAETLFRVHGDLESDPTEPDHSVPYDYPAIPYESSLDVVAARLSQSGTAVSPLPRAIDYGPNGRCVMCPTCDGYVCTHDAKMDAETAALRPALASGRVELLAATKCLRILTDENGVCAVGVELLRNGRTFRVSAKTVIVSAGVIRSPLLLWRSRSRAHPNGLGNSTGALGRYYCGHALGIGFVPTSFRRRPVLHQKSFCVNEFYLRSPGSPHPAGTFQTTGQIPMWEGLGPVKRSVARQVANRSLPIMLMSEFLPNHENRLHFEDDNISLRFTQNNLKAFRRIRKLFLSSFRRAGYPLAFCRRTPVDFIGHAVGTARSGDDPQTSVVDRWCRVHDLDNVHVLDSSFMPSAGAVNLALTIAAQALRVCDHIAHVPPPSGNG
jgi:choline dehydrogenase-like flavoprotein